MSPYEILFNQGPRVPLDMKFRTAETGMPIRQDVLNSFDLERFFTERSQMYQAKWKMIREKPRSYQLASKRKEWKRGMLVMMRNHKRKKGEAKWKGPLLVLEETAHGVIVKSVDGNRIPVHRADIKPFKWRGDRNGAVAVERSEDQIVPVGENSVGTTEIDTGTISV